MKTGTAAFGQKGQYGILTKSDAARMLRLAILGAIANPGEAYALRQLVRRMVGYIEPVNLLLLADTAEGACSHQGEWVAFAQELRERAKV